MLMLQLAAWRFYSVFKKMWLSKVRGWGCIGGGYFRVVAQRTCCSCWKTGGLSQGGVVKHNVLQEELSPGAWHCNIRPAFSARMSVGGTAKHAGNLKNARRIQGYKISYHPISVDLFFNSTLNSTAHFRTLSKSRPHLPLLPHMTTLLHRLKDGK